VSYRPPAVELTDRQQALLRAAFRSLLDDGSPAGPQALADEVGADVDDVEADLARLDGLGRIKRGDSGEVLGSFGLTVVDTHHEISVAGARRHTWCALDAVGIIAALDADGWIESTNRSTGRTFRLEFSTGRPAPGSDPCVLFVAEGEPVASVIDQWCPLVNFFDDERAADEWAHERNVSGRSFSLDEATELGVSLWRPLIGRSTTG
jgi:hypothetical protein